MTDPPAVKLSFRMIVNGIKEAYDWSILNHRQTGAAKVLQNFLQALCLKDFDKGEMYKAIRARRPFDEVLAANPVLKQYLELCIELDMYPSIPMHMFFLGVQKSLLVEGKNLKWIDNKITRQWLINLRSTMLESQRELSKLSLDWCRVMAFTSEDKMEFGSGYWQSRNYSSFTRVSLFQFSALDPSTESFKLPYDLRDAVAAYRKMTVLWFCVVANAFAPENVVNSNRVENLVRLFLSACVDFHHAKNSGEEDDPFFVGKPNFFSLLNVKELIDTFASLDFLWEGLDEAFIKFFKREISVVRHHPSYLSTLLDKVMTTSVFKHLCEKYKMWSRTEYSNLFQFRVYNKDLSTVLQENEYVTGVIDKNGDLYCCLEEERSGVVKLFRINFDDGEGVWILNLWYAKARIGSLERVVDNRAILLDEFHDFFLLLKMKPEICSGESSNNQRRSTVICKSWRVRVENGHLEYPMPNDECLTDDNGYPT
jgi:hypothetical protein